MYNINDITNKVLFGNSEEELLKIPDESIDAVIIDPPYRYLKHKLDRPFNERLIFENLYRVLKKNSLMVIFGIGSQLCRDIVMLEDIGFKCKEEVIWVKERSSSFMCSLPRQHELCYILEKGSKKINKVYVDAYKKSYYSNNFDSLERVYNAIKSALVNKKDIEYILKYINEGVFEFNKNKLKPSSIINNNPNPDNYRVVGDVRILREGFLQTTIFDIKREYFEYEHATQKPIELMSRIVKLVSNENDVILDCFAGSGSTLLGAIKNDRNYIGIEIDKEYYDVCIKRLKEHQGLFL